MLPDNSTLMDNVLLVTILVIRLLNVFLTKLSLLGKQEKKTMRNTLTMPSLLFNMKFNAPFAISLGIGNLNAGEKDDKYLRNSKWK